MRVRGAVLRVCVYAEHSLECVCVCVCAEYSLESVCVYAEHSLECVCVQSTP